MTPVDREVIEAANLHQQLRDVLIAAFPRASAQAIAAALYYELVSTIAMGTESKADALKLLDSWHETGREQIRTFGVGKPHP